MVVIQVLKPEYQVLCKLWYDAVFVKSYMDIYMYNILNLLELYKILIVNCTFIL